jgi:hypothetical protein
MDDLIRDCWRAGNRGSHVRIRQLYAIESDFLGGVLMEWVDPSRLSNG